MAIKIIKHGETKFKITCPICGCEFEYEFEDLVERYNIIKQVKCPDCGEWLTHKEIYPTYPNYPNRQPNIEPFDPIIKPYVTWTKGPDIWPDCETCPNKPDPTKIVVGDTPCTWCKKNLPYCGDVFPKDYKGGSYSVNPKDFASCTYTNTAEKFESATSTKTKK